MDFMMKYRSKQMHFQRQTGEELTLQLMFYLVRDYNYNCCVVCDALICQVRFLSNRMEKNYFKVKS